MPRVQLASLGPGVAQTSAGAASPGKAGTIALHSNGSPVPVYPSETSGVADTSGTFTTDSLGHVPGWVDSAYFGVAVDITVPPAVPITVILGGPQGPPGVGAAWQGVWASGTTYAKGAGVSRSGQNYISNTNGNINHDPATDSGTNWAPLGGSFAPLADPTFTGVVTVPMLAIGGIGAASPVNFVGSFAVMPPPSGTYPPNSMALCTADGRFYYSIAGGTPGIWTTPQDVGPVSPPVESLTERNSS